MLISSIKQYRCDVIGNYVVAICPLSVLILTSSFCRDRTCSPNCDEYVSWSPFTEEEVRQEAQAGQKTIAYVGVGGV